MFNVHLRWKLTQNTNTGAEAEARKVREEDSESNLPANELLAVAQSFRAPVVTVRASRRRCFARVPTDGTKRRLARSVQHLDEVSGVIWTKRLRSNIGAFQKRDVPRSVAVVLSGLLPWAPPRRTLHGPADTARRVVCSGPTALRRGRNAVVIVEDPVRLVGMRAAVPAIALLCVASTHRRVTVSWQPRARGGHRWLFGDAV